MFLRKLVLILTIFNVLVTYDISGSLPDSKVNKINSQDSDLFIDISLQKQDNFALIEEHIKELFFLKKLIIKSDIAINHDDYRELLELKENSRISAEDIKRACFYLKATGKFDTVKVKIDNHDDKDQNNKILTLELNSCWTFSKLKIKGLILSKDKYKQYYIFKPGQVFDLIKHQKGLVKIQNKLKDEGYLNAQLAELVKYNKHDKTVDIEISINKYSKFIIKKINIDIKFSNLSLENDFIDLKSKIEAQVLSDVVSGYYSLELIDTKVKEIKDYLVSKGIWDSRVEINIKINKNASIVNLNVLIDIKQDKRLIFFGNHTFDTSLLLSKVLLTDSFLIMPPPFLLKEELEKFYKQNGFWKISIDLKEENNKLFFVISEGKSINIIKFNIKDINNKLIKDNNVESLLRNLKNASYNESVLNAKLSNLVSCFIEKGYWDCKVYNKIFRPTNNKDEYELDIIISKGILNKINNIKVKGYSGLEQELPYFKELPFAVTTEVINAQKQWLKDYFTDKGHIGINIAPELSKNKYYNDLIWLVDFDRSITKFGKTVILGDNNIDQNILLKELDYQENDLFDQNKLYTSIDRLKSLGVFEHVNLMPYDICFNNSQPLILNYVTDDPFELKLRSGVQYFSKNFAGYGGWSYKLGSSFLWKNPTHKADLLSLSLDFTRYSRNILAFYQCPWIWGYPLYTNFKAYSMLYEQPLFFGSSNNIYKVSQDGFNFNLRSIKIAPKLDCNIGFEVSKTFGMTNPIAQVINYNPNLINRPISYLYIEPNVFYSTFDTNVYDYSTFGYALLLALKGQLAFDVSNFSFVKFLLEQSFYFPISQFLSGAFRFRAGHIFVDSIKNIVPTERFYLGGGKTIRGYEPYMVPPLNKFCINDKTFWIPVGGKSMININSEIRFPIYKNISGVFFNDMGVLSNNGIINVKNQPWEGASGIGLRYNTLLGPLRFDIGFKWRKHLSIEKNYVWYLNFGHAF